MKNKSFSIVYGGLSTEHDVSVNSFLNIYNTIKSSFLYEYLYSVIYIDTDGKVYESSKPNRFKIDKDILNKKNISIYTLMRKIKNKKIYIYSLLYGGCGEDGSIQGMANILGIKNNFGTIFSSALSINKYFMYQYFTNNKNFKMPKTIQVKNSKYLDEVIQSFTDSIVVKPNSMGSSKYIQIYKQDSIDLKLLSKQCDDILKLNNDSVLFQEYINGIEYTCSCSDFNGFIQTFPLVKVSYADSVYSYDLKYDEYNYYTIIKEKEESSLETKIKEITKEIYISIECTGTIRVDFIVKDAEIYLLEINTLPGLTEVSSLVLMLKEYDVSLERYLAKQIGIIND